MIRPATVEPIAHDRPDDLYLALKALAEYSGLSVRTLRGHLRAPQLPLPHYRVGGKILVRRSEFDVWMRRHFHRIQDRDGAMAMVNQVVDELCAEMSSALTAAAPLPENRASSPQRRRG